MNFGRLFLFKKHVEIIKSLFDQDKVILKFL
jgi:hypothetical protein